MLENDTIPLNGHVNIFSENKFLSSSNQKILFTFQIQHQ